ncbi:MAG TPA: hypothetical protein VH228_04845 [Nocardioides sp.]|nr:hypothetical protein [Nocardioides sp.]
MTEIVSYGVVYDAFAVLLTRIVADTVAGAAVVLAMWAGRPAPSAADHRHPQLVE